MNQKLFNIRKGIPRSFNNTVEVKVFQNKNNKQFNLPVLKKNTSPEIIKDILNNENVVGLKFKITKVILKNAMGKDVIFKDNERRNKKNVKIQ